MSHIDALKTLRDMQAQIGCPYDMVYKEIIDALEQKINQQHTVMKTTLTKMKAAFPEIWEKYSAIAQEKI